MALVKRFPLTCDEARGLTCPFTGKELVIYANVCEGVVTYNAPKAFSLHTPRASLDALLRDASMRNGVYGVVSPEDIYKDPYSGDDFTVVKTDDGKYYFQGGWDPQLPSFSLADCIRNLSCGKRVLDAAPKAESVEHIAELKPDDSDSAHVVVDDLTEKAAQEIVNVIPGVNKGRTTTGYRGGRKK